MPRTRAIEEQRMPRTVGLAAAWRLGRVVLLLCAALLLCSCRSVSLPRSAPAAAGPRGLAGGPAMGPAAGMSFGGDAFSPDVQQAAYYPPSLPANAWTGAPAPQAGGCCPPGMAGVWSPEDMYATTWRPPGLSGVWPADEYLFDGGDHPPPVEVMQDWTVLGLDQEDTIAHYDTLDGRTRIEAANRVPIYAPRFASVRQIASASLSHGRDRLAGVELPTSALLQEDQQLATTVIQPIQAGQNLGIKASQDFRERLQTVGVTGDVLLARMDNRFKIHEDFQIIRAGRFDNSEKARLAIWLAAAQVWESDQAAQVMIDQVTAVLATGHRSAQSVYEYELPEGKPRLRIVKVASAAQAQPGEEIEFTLRFDNLGDQVLGNVTVIDNLATRLEYLPNTAECSLNARFLTQENDGESLVLRWEILDPLPVGQGGIIRFRCRVR